MQERFERHFIPEPNSGCWLWTAGGVKFGYGMFNVTHEKAVPAHRVAWEIYRGPIPEGAFILHKCDTPACVNPNHLRLGTQGDNMRDMVRKGRAPRNRAKLSAEAVRDIRSSTLSGAALANKHGVSASTVSRTRLRQTSGHVQ